MYDLIYFDQDREAYDDIGDKLRKNFPAAEVSDASDEIHGYRLSIEDQEEAREGVWRLLLQERWPQTLGIQMACRSDDPHYELLKRLVAERKDDDE